MKLWIATPQDGKNVVSAYDAEYKFSGEFDIKLSRGGSCVWAVRDDINRASFPFALGDTKENAAEALIAGAKYQMEQHMREYKALEKVTESYTEFLD